MSLHISVDTIRHTRRMTTSTMPVFLVLLLSLPTSLLLQSFSPQSAGAAAAPTISSLSPTSGPTSGGTATTITGSNFFRGKGVTQLAAGGQHTCATANGKAYCWGNNSSGQLGDNSTTNSLTPVPVDTSGALSGKTITDISASMNHTCVVADQRAYCWGSNTDGKLGNGTTSTGSLVPVAVGGALADKNVNDISTSAPGGDHTCAVAEGAAYCWGNNMWQQLGIGTSDYDPHPNPLTVDTSGALSGKSVTAISAGSNHTCAVADGAAYCWGFNDAGSLGNGFFDPSSTPVAVDTTGVLSGKTVTKVSVHVASCAVADGRAYCWGSNTNGRLGDGTTTDRSVPVAVTTSGSLGGKAVTDISARGLHTCAIADDTPYCWGDNINGGLGNGTTTTSLTPVAVSTPLGPVTNLTSGDQHTCATNRNEISCWGFNNSGQVGDGTTVTPRASPVTTNATAIPASLNPTVSFGGVNAPSVTYTSSTQLTVVAPAHSAGIVDVTLTNPDGQSTIQTASYTYITPATAPSSPQELSTTPAENGVRLTWSAPDDDGGAPVTDYLAEYSDNNGESWQVFTRPASIVRDVTVTGLSTGTTYSFRVSAINSVGSSPPSAVATGEVTYLELNSTSTVAIDLLPTPQSRTSSASHTVTTTTNAPNGYNLSVSMAGADRSLSQDGQTILATSGSLANPTPLELNSWGFRVAGIGGFGSGGSLETNVATSAYTWAGMPASTSPATIKTTSSPAQDDTTTVWYGIRADTQKPSGTYSGTITYTAVSN